MKTLEELRKIRAKCVGRKGYSERLADIEKEIAKREAAGAS